MGNRLRIKPLKKRLTKAQRQRRQVRLERRALLNPMKTLEGNLQ